MLRQMPGLDQSHLVQFLDELFHDTDQKTCRKHIRHRKTDGPQQLRKIRSCHQNPSRNCNNKNSWRNQSAIRILGVYGPTTLDSPEESGLQVFQGRNNDCASSQLCGTFCGPTRSVGVYLNLSPSQWIVPFFSKVRITESQLLRIRKTCEPRFK